MNLRQVIEAEKVVSDYGTWHHGQVPAAEFPLRSRRKLKLSKDWAWRIVKFSALDQNFLLLVRVNVLIEEYYAHLGHVRPDGLAVICSHDLHVSHKNWHCHFVRGDIFRTEAGYLRDKYNTIAFPGGRNTECTVKFEVTTANAISIAARRYRFREPPQQEFGV